MSKDPVVLETAVAREEAALEEWPPGGDKLTELQRGMALAKLGEAWFRLRRMQEAANRLEEADRALSAVPEMRKAQAGAGRGAARPGALSRRDGRR